MIINNTEGHTHRTASPARLGLTRKAPGLSCKATGQVRLTCKAYQPPIFAGKLVHHGLGKGFARDRHVTALTGKRIHVCRG